MGSEDGLRAGEMWKAQELAAVPSGLLPKPWGPGTHPDLSPVSLRRQEGGTHSGGCMQEGLGREEMSRWGQPEDERRAEQETCQRRLVEKQVWEAPLG